MNDFIELRKVITILLRRWSLLLLTTLLAVTATYLVTRALPTIYKGTVTVMVGESLQNTQVNREGLMVSDLLVYTYVQMVTSQPVLEGTVQALGLQETWQSLKRQVHALRIESTQLLKIEVEAETPEEAKLIADEVARQLIFLSPTAVQNRENEDTRTFMRQRAANLQAKIEAGQQRLETIDALLANSLTTEQVSELQDEINTTETLITRWEDTYTQLLVFIESRRAPNILVVVDPAQVTVEPPMVELFTFIGGLVGLLSGVGIIFLLEVFNDTVRSTDDFSSLNLEVLGTIDHIKGKTYPHKLITARNSFAPTTEAYRIIRSNIQFIWADQFRKSILVTSPTSGEGKSTTVANLGVVMAQIGYKTVIVDADLRQPTLHKIFQLTHEEGLADLLRQPENEVEPYLKSTGIENLQIITSGILPPNPSELLCSLRMKQLVAHLKEMADIIIFDAPPVLLVTDAVVLASQADSVILVIKAEETKRDEVKQTLLSLQRTKTYILGGIFNQTSNRGYYYRRFGKKNSPNLQSTRKGNSVKSAA
jgi:non-specific protein-tyrosine kinase